VCAERAMPSRQFGRMSLSSSRCYPPDIQENSQHYFKTFQNNTSQSFVETTTNCVAPFFEILHGSSPYPNFEWLETRMGGGAGMWRNRPVAAGVPGHLCCAACAHAPARRSEEHAAVPGLEGGNQIFYMPHWFYWFCKQNWLGFIKKQLLPPHVSARIYMQVDNKQIPTIVAIVLRT